jgi:hypothetical protein
VTCGLRDVLKEGLAFVAGHPQVKVLQRGRGLDPLVLRCTFDHRQRIAGLLHDLEIVRVLGGHVVHVALLGIADRLAYGFPLLVGQAFPPLQIAVDRIKRDAGLQCGHMFRNFVPFA